MKTLMALALLTLVAACAKNPHKAEKIETQIEHADKVKSEEEVGVKDGNMVVQKKTLMSEELRRLQYEVYELEDHVYGNAKYGSKGLYGVLKDCRKDLSSKENGGTGKLMWTEPIDRVTDKEEEWKIGLDDKNKVVGVSEEFLKDRISRFQEYKRVLMKRQEEYQDKVDICKAELRSRKQETAKAQEGAGE
ncbi:MAG TPA: hypothetical protein VFV50_08890 [Bdellovibrionales bacterium]|nr:hypothetical protein [Bdellovibrionales bacterium]